MYAHVRGLRATILSLIAFVIASNGAWAQNARLAAPAPPSISLSLPPLALGSCVDDALLTVPIPRAAALSADSPRANCETPPIAATSIATSLATPIEPCAANGHALRGCSVQQDGVPLALESLGKKGVKILRAREGVLEILESENACSAWYQGKDANPAATFRTISFELDRKGEDSVQESRDRGLPVVFRNPYVARVIQGDGANATITLNERGAFFVPTARVLGVHKEGGPPDFRGQRTLRVGPYEGDTFQAQVLTLLHEFGHALDLLPTDEHDADGRSEHNNEEVLRYCRREVEGKSTLRILPVAQ